MDFFLTLFYIIMHFPGSPQEYAQYTDPRDGKTYRTIFIGDKLWFAENLNYDTPLSVCYEHHVDNCEKYGRLYPHTEAVHACPEYWTLPDSADIRALHQLAGTKKLRAFAEKGVWDVKGAEKFDNATGLSILPAGRIDEYSFYSHARERWVDTVSFHQLGYAASFWLNSTVTDRGLVHWHFGTPVGHATSGLHRHDIEPAHKFSVRCVCEKNRQHSPKTW